MVLMGVKCSGGQRSIMPGGGQVCRDEGRADAVYADVILAEESRADGAGEADKTMLRCAVLGRKGEGVQSSGGRGDDHVGVEVVWRGIGRRGKGALALACIVDEEFEAIEYTEEIDIEAFQVRRRGFGVKAEVREDTFTIPDASVGRQEVDAAAALVGMPPIESSLKHGSRIGP